MREIRMSKDKLLAILRKNRDEHRAVFAEAEVSYREKVMLALITALDRVKKEGVVELEPVAKLTPPEDYTAEYERSIKMLELSLDKSIVLSEMDFRTLVQDEWEWTQRWALSNSRYCASPKLAATLKGRH